jgi:predicted permease
MTAGNRTSLAVRWSVRCYRIAVWTFPRAFRARFGDQLISAFADAVTEHHARQGLRGIARLWRRTLADLVRHAPAEHWSAWSGRPLALSAPKNQPMSGGFRDRARVAPQIESFVQDVRFAGRTLIRTPWISLALVATIGLGIGATTTIFTVVHGVLLKALPFDGSERVVRLCEVSARTADFCVASAVNVTDLARVSQQLEEVGIVRNESFVATIDDASFPVRGAIATSGFFGIAGLRPELGRVFTDADLDPGANQVAVVSGAFWQRHLGGDPSAIGQTLTLDGSTVRLIGILPTDAYLPLLPSVEVWRPLTASVDDVTQRAWRGFLVIGRLAPETTREALDAELSGLYGQLAEAYPTAHEGWTIRSVGLRDEMVGDYRSVLWVFQGAVALVLLIACANVASLLLVRASTRTSEFAVRTALGAGRGRVFRQLLTESLTLSVAGAVAGVLLAY